ncbi:MAG TPA: hypothetical protein PLP17_02850 [Oligoflexia bacterium]|nr:hypothetical protein [Oligoflexia bacterium]
MDDEVDDDEEDEAEVELLLEDELDEEELEVDVDVDELELDVEVEVELDEEAPGTSTIFSSQPFMSPANVNRKRHKSCTRIAVLLLSGEDWSCFNSLAFMRDKIAQRRQNCTIFLIAWG